MQVQLQWKLKYRGSLSLPSTVYLSANWLHLDDADHASKFEAEFPGTVGVVHISGGAEPTDWQQKKRKHAVKAGGWASTGTVSSVAPNGVEEKLLTVPTAPSAGNPRSGTEAPKGPLRICLSILSKRKHSSRI
jgi:hypothetical protein